MTSAELAEKALSFLRLTTEIENGSRCDTVPGGRPLMPKEEVVREAALLCLLGAFSGKPDIGPLVDEPVSDAVQPEPATTEKAP